jgi:DNA-binding response OmpR family regulator
MKTEAKSQVMLHDIKILIVGNNPIELSHVFKNLSEVQGSKLVTEIAFDFKTIRERLSTFMPNFIFIDDNIGKMELKHVIDSLAKRKTKGIPITILKSSIEKPI